MQVQELYKLTKWITKNVVDNQIEKLYQTLFAVLDQNSKRQNNRPVQPFEEQKCALLESLTEIEFSSLTNAQIKALEQLNLYNNIGQQGCDKIEEIMGKTLDIAHVAASINEMKSEITSGVTNSKAIFNSLSFFELDSDDEVPEGKVLTRLTFDNVASIKDITQLEKWSDNWADISRGFAVSVGQRPEDVEIISASRGSFILDLAIYTTLAMPILKALKMVGDCLLKVQKLELNSLNIRKLKLELPAMEQQLEEQASSSDELAQTLKEEIVTEITAEIKASINDFKFTHHDETAQIDHLIVYTYGFVLIESKSIKGEVKVNGLGEWTRSLKSKWAGMASPIKQVELQQKLLREMLHANRENILGKLLGFKQQSFGMRCWDNVCAVSSNAVIDRDSMPNDVSKQLVKTEFLVDKLNEIMKLKNYAITKLNPFDTRPDFKDEELKSITSFLMAQLGDNKTVEKVVKQEVAPAPVNTNVDSILRCKSCGEKSDYLAQHGRYGYFIKCNKCETNTAMKMPCVGCGSKNTRVSKKKETYMLKCGDCEQDNILI